jgi:hypothetical protein
LNFYCGNFYAFVIEGREKDAKMEVETENADLPYQGRIEGGNWYVLLSLFLHQVVSSRLSVNFYSGRYSAMPLHHPPTRADPNPGNEFQYKVMPHVSKARRYGRKLEFEYVKTRKMTPRLWNCNLRGRVRGRR